MINFDDNVDENKTEHNLKRPYSPDHPYRILITNNRMFWIWKSDSIIKSNKQPARYW